MITNNRTMGDKAGYFYGKEIENTRFRGMDTVFFSRYTAAQLWETKCRKLKHLFFGLMNPSFWDLGHAVRGEFFQQLENMMVRGYFVSIEVLPEQALWPELTTLRMLPVSAKQLCVLIAVELPVNLIVNYAIKTVPPTAFGRRTYEEGVITADFGAYKTKWHPDWPVVSTLWPEYKADEDGE